MEAPSHLQTSKQTKKIPSHLGYPKSYLENTKLFWAVNLFHETLTGIITHICVKSFWVTHRRIIFHNQHHYFYNQQSDPFWNCLRIISFARIRIWVRPQYHDYFFLQMIFFEGITLLVDTIKSLQRKWSQYTHKNMLLIHTSTKSTLLWRLLEQGKKVGIIAATATEDGYSKCCQEIVCNVDINYD